VKLNRERVAQLFQQQVEEVSDKTNHRLGILSVLSAIFLRLRLLTGIFGMNFNTCLVLGGHGPTLLSFF
jgi:Mg2+ and Co2+ transporter CorA